MRRVTWTGHAKWVAVRTILSLAVLAAVVTHAAVRGRYNLADLSAVIVPIALVAQVALLAVIAIPTAPDD